MSTFRRMMQWVNLALLLGTAGLCIPGAFLGAERAKVLFNTPPMQALWMLLALWLALGLLCFPAVRRRPALIALHLGPLLILLGSMANSIGGHRLLARWAGHALVPSGMMALYEGETSGDILDAHTSQPIGQLPLHIRLDSFSMEYYSPDKTSDAEEEADTPARPPIKAYISRITLVDPSGKIPECRAELCVNHPLRIGGYHVYQYSFGRDMRGVYSIYLVASAQGLAWVYAGFALVLAGGVAAGWKRKTEPVS